MKVLVACEFSGTFKGIAEAMAQQWGELTHELN